MDVLAGKLEHVVQRSRSVTGRAEQRRRDCCGKIMPLFFWPVLRIKEEKK